MFYGAETAKKSFAEGGLRLQIFWEEEEVAGANSTETRVEKDWFASKEDIQFCYNKFENPNICVFPKRAKPEFLFYLLILLSIYTKNL